MRNIAVLIQESFEVVRNQSEKGEREEGGERWIGEQSKGGGQRGRRSHQGYS